MAAKSKKRLSKIENKLLKLDKLELKDVFCSICQSILIEPVTLPCFHDFCQSCFNGSIENNALCCPLCRLRIGSWLRTATKQKNLVNVELWNLIKSKFSREIDTKSRGEDISLPEEKPPLPRLSEPGEIRSEYEAELKRLRAERLRLEQFEESELLIKKIQQEEEVAHKKYLENLKKDEILAQQMQNEHSSAPPPNTPRKLRLRSVTAKPRLKATKIDGYLSKVQAPTVKDSPLLTEDSTSTDGSTPKVPIVNGTSPEIVPNYGKFIKNFIDKKNKLAPGLWNKENGESVKETKEEPKPCDKQIDKIDGKAKVKNKNSVPSLLVSLPLPYSGILQHKINITENRSKETGSVDSMRQELCYFKPIEGTTPTSFGTSKGMPLRVPGLRVKQEPPSPCYEPPPSRAQYIEGLCRLRNLSISKKLPSAFVIAINMLRVAKVECLIYYADATLLMALLRGSCWALIDALIGRVPSKESPIKCESNLRSKIKKTASTNPFIVRAVPVRRNPNRNKQSSQIDGITKLNNETNLRRTRSMGSISKDDNETTPKKSKIKQRKVSSERKPYLRSNSKKSSTNKESGSSSTPLIPESLNNNKVNLAVKNLSSPLKNCDVKKILQEQLRIEKIIEQEQNDYELARKMEAEWNGRRQSQRAAIKRQMTLNYALRPAKKLKA